MSSSCWESRPADGHSTDPAQPISEPRKPGTNTIGSVEGSQASASTPFGSTPSVRSFSPVASITAARTPTSETARA